MTRSDRIVFTGIDFGTTSSAIGYVTIAERTGQITDPRAVEHLGSSKIPTAVYLHEDAQHPYVGQEAVNEAPNDPDCFFTNFKGQLDSPQPVRTFPNGLAPTPKQLASYVLKHLTNIANDREIPLERTAICHPVGRTWEKLLIQIIHELGVADAHPISEPHAALYYADYLYKLFDDRVQKTLLVDFGGGTCDLFLLEVNTRLFSRFWVNYGRYPKAQEQLTYQNNDGNILSYGGRDIDRLLVDLIIQQWQEQNNFDASEHLLQEPQYLWQLSAAAREAKENLSTYILTPGAKDSYTIHLTKLPNNTEVKFKLSKETFTNLVKPDLESKFLSFFEAENGFFQRASVKNYDVDYVILVGGSSRLPWLKDIISEICPKAALRKQIYMLEQPEMAVAYGAALYNYYYQIERLPLKPSLDETLKLGVGNEVYTLAKKNTILPYTSNQFRSTHYIQLKQVSDTLLLQLYLGDGETVLDCRPLGEEREIKFSEKLKAGTRLTLKVRIDQIGHLDLTVHPYGKPQMAQEVRFESLNVI